MLLFKLLLLITFNTECHVSFTFPEHPRLEGVSPCPEDGPDVLGGGSHQPPHHLLGGRHRLGLGDPERGLLGDALQPPALHHV